MASKYGQRTPDFPTETPAFIWHFLKRHIKLFGPIAFLMLFWSANDALYPYFIKMIVNAVDQHQGPKADLWDQVMLPFWLLAGSFIIMEIAMRVMNILMVYAYPNIRKDMRMSVVHYIKDHDLTYYLNSLSGNIANRVHDIPKSTQDLLESLIDNLIAIVFSFLFMMIVLWTASPIFSALLLVWTAWHMGVTFFFFKELTSKSRDHANKVSKLQGTTVDFISNILTVRLFARGHRELDKIKDMQKEEVAYSIRASWAYSKVNLLRGLGGLVFVILTIYFLIQGWIDGWISTGDFPLVAIASFQMLGHIWHLSMSFQSMFRKYGNIDSALQICRRAHNIVDQPNAKDLSVSSGAIDLKNVMFHYKKDTPLFEDLNINIKGGEKVGLVGYSGSGKTTLVNLLLRFYDIQFGQICIDDQNIQDITQSSLRSQIAMIPQEPSLFHRTLMENIRVGRHDATDDEVIAAAKQAHCHEFINKLEDGYDTIVGERGLKLSGGQRQRIAIARAILKDAPILIMDEATSALDSATETCIQESLATIMENRTVIVVAHRLSTLSNMDRIIVFDQGRVVEDGSIQQLLKTKDGAFAQLWRLQHDGFLPENRES